MKAARVPFRARRAWSGAACIGWPRASTSTCRRRCRHPLPLTLPTAPQKRDPGPGAHGAADHRHAERLLRTRRLGRPPRRRLQRPDRAPIAPLQRLLPPLRAAAPASSGSTGAIARISPHAAQPDHLYKPYGAGVRPWRSAARLGRARAAKGQLGGAIVDELVPEPEDLRVDKVPHQRLLGHAARRHPAQPGHPHRAVRGRQHRPVRAVHAAGRELPRLTAACCCPIALRDDSRLRAPRRCSRRSASASSPTPRRADARSARQVPARAAVAEEVRVLQRAQHALVGVDAREQHGADGQVAQDAVRAACPRSR